MSPLHVLVGAGHVAGTTLLLKAGASPNGVSHSNDETYRLSGQWGKQTAEGSTAPLPTEDRTALHVALEAEPPLEPYPHLYPYPYPYP